MKYVKKVIRPIKYCGIIVYMEKSGSEKNVLK